MHAAFMEEAVRLSLEEMRRGSGGPFGAVVVRDSAIVGRGGNRVLRDCDPTAHAEVVAIREACRSSGRFHLDDCDLYASCEPCPMCLAAAYWAHIRTIYYAAGRDDAARAGFDDAAIYDELGLPPADRRIPMIRVAAPGALAALAEWAAKADKTAY